MLQKMAFNENQNQFLTQMQWELEVARKQIDMLTNQNQQVAEEITRLRNQNMPGAFGPQNGPRQPYM